MQWNQENNTENEKFNRDIEIIKENQTEVLELKNTMNKLKNGVESINIALIK